MAVERQIPAAVRLAAERHATGEELAVLCVPYDVGGALPNRTRGKHWRVHHLETQEARLAAMLAHRWADDPMLHEPVSVLPIILREKVVDPDNALAAVKHVADWFTGRLWPDDSARWVEWLPVVQINGLAWRRMPGWTVLLVRSRGVA